MGIIDGRNLELASLPLDRLEVQVTTWAEFITHVGNFNTHVGDKDNGLSSPHHTLGTGMYQAAAGNHLHDSAYISIVPNVFFIAGNFPIFDSGGEITGSPYSPSSFSVPGHNHNDAYISIISLPNNGNFPIMTSQGELNSSVYGPTSFQAAGAAPTPHQLSHQSSSSVDRLTGTLSVNVTGSAGSAYYAS